MFNEYENLKFYCQSVLPTVYDDTLSYYELLNKVVEHLNKLGNNVNEIWAKLIKLHIVSEATVNTPEQFGAKGDGITDDSEPIQQMFDNIRAGIIVFNANANYRITKPLNIYGGYSTLTVLLGSILYDGLITSQAVITVKEELSKGDNFGRGGVKLIGGYVNCNRLSGCGVRLYNVFAPCLTNVKIANYMEYGIDIGDNDFINGNKKTISAQAIIEGCYIDNFLNANTGTAIRIVHTDNNISNCVTNGGIKAIECIYGGNFISNCHFTLYADRVAYPSVNWSFIYNNVVSHSAVQTNSFSNCYFNGSCKYLIENNKSNSLVTVLNGCSVILGSDKVGYTCYLQTDELSTVQINELNVRKSAITKFIGLIRQTGTQGILTRSNISMNNGAERTQNDCDIVNLSKNPSIIQSNSLTLKSHNLRRIATVIEPTDLNGGFIIKVSISGVILNISGRVSSQNKATISYVNGSALDYPDIEFYMDNAPKIFDMGEGLEMRGADLYIYNNGDNDLTNIITAFSDNEFYPLDQVFVYQGEKDIETQDLSGYYHISR